MSEKKTHEHDWIALRSLLARESRPWAYECQYIGCDVVSTVIGTTGKDKSPSIPTRLRPAPEKDGQREPSQLERGD